MRIPALIYFEIVKQKNHDANRKTPSLAILGPVAGARNHFWNVNSSTHV